MAKDRGLVAGDGTTGPTGAEVRLLMNDLIPGKSYVTPVGFNWAGSLTPYEGKVLRVTNDYDLAGGNITLPLNCHIVFDGGQLLNVGTITGNRSVILNMQELQQVFSSSTNFAGTWIGGLLTPQAFGAVCSPNSTTIVGAVNSAPALQKLFDCPIPKRIPAGFYYRSGAAVTITNPLTVFMEGDLVVTRQSGYSDRPDHVHFYSDNNNPFFEIRSSEVYMRGFTCDVRPCAAYTSAVILGRGDYRMWGGDIDVSIIDNVANCRVATGGQGSGVPVEDWVGAKGFHWVTEDVSTDWGYICDAMINVTTQNIAYPIIIEEATESPATGTWTTTMRVSGTWVAYRSIYLGKCSAGKLEAVMQTGYTIPVADKNTIYSGFINDGWTVDIVPWDLSGSESGSFAYHALGLVLGDSVALTGNSLIGFNFSNWFSGGAPKSTQYVDNKSNIILLRDRWSNNTFISQLDNTLIGFTEYGNTYSFAARSGASINFDTELVPGLQPTTPHITLNGTANLFSFSRLVSSENNPPRWQFGASANLNLDYVELVLEAPTNNIISNNMYLHMLYELARCRRIQFIGLSTSDVYTTHNFYLPSSNMKYIHKLVTNGSFKRVVFRFIGSTSTAGTIYLLDLANQNNHRNNIVYRQELKLEYSAYITQTGTANPVVVNTRKDTLGTPTITRSGIGDFNISLFGQITVDKFEQLDKVDYLSDGSRVVITRVNNNTARMRTYNAAGSLADSVITAGYLLTLTRLV